MTRSQLSILSNKASIKWVTQHPLKRGCAHRFSIPTDQSARCQLGQDLPDRRSLPRCKTERFLDERCDGLIDHYPSLPAPHIAVADRCWPWPLPCPELSLSHSP